MKFLNGIQDIKQIAFYAALMAPNFVLAQTTSAKPVFSGLSDVAAKLCTVFKWLFTFALIISFIYFVLAGIRYTTAGGNPEKVKGVHQALLWGVVGIAVALAARSVPTIIATFLNATGKITGPGAC